MNFIYSFLFPNKEYTSPTIYFAKSVIEKLEKICGNEKAYIGGSFALHTFLDKSNLIKKSFKPDDLDIFVNVNSKLEFSTLCDKFIKLFDVSSVKYNDDLNNIPDRKDEEFHENVVGVLTVGINNNNSNNCTKVQIVGIKKIIENDLFCDNILSIVDQPTKVLMTKDKFIIKDLEMLVSGVISDNQICESRREKYKERGFSMKE
jgi:hypothetical protein